jgi:hypothetical protein
LAYCFKTNDNITFQLYENSNHLFDFTRKNMREAFEYYANANDLSSKWIGAVMRIFWKKYPAPIVRKERTDLERLVDKIGIEGIADYLRSKGLRVVKKLNVRDDQLVELLESHGYLVEGLIEDVFYSSIESNRN